MFSKLKKIINDLSGSLLIIIDENDKLANLAQNNSKITYLDIMEKKAKSKCFGIGKRKTVNIKKLQKKYKKKSIDYLLVDCLAIKKYMQYFIKNSVYINGKELFLFGNLDDVDLDLIIKRYNRYNVKIQKEIFDKQFILIVDNTKSKNNCFKDKWYFIKDTLFIAVDAIGDLLAS